MNLEKDKISNLFMAYFIPTVSAMIVTALYIIVDGIFVGKGIGSDGVAAVGIVIPIFTVFQSIQLLFGVGGSTVASIALARGNQKSANNIFTQSTLLVVVIMVTLTSISLLNTERIAILLGANEAILPNVKIYFQTMVIYAVFSTLSPMWGFFVRLDGAPKYAMFSMIAGALINVLLDYIFIFPLQMGIYGAALATGIGHITSVIILGYYFIKKSKNFKIVSFKLNVEDIKRSIKIGIPGFMTNIFTAIVIITLNTVIIKRLGKDGVSTYGIINYLHPLILFIFMSIGQSLQPIASYNYGKGNISRMKEVYRFGQKIAILIGILFTFIGLIGSELLTSLFIDRSSPSFELAVSSIPLYYLNYIFYGISAVSVSYYQAIEETKKANLITIGRGFIFVIGAVLILPSMIGDIGIWIATPISEFLGFLMVIYYHFKEVKVNSQENIVEIV